MARISIGFMILFLFWNCAKREEKIVIKNKPYVISYEDEKFIKYADSLKKNTNKVALRPKGFYGECQLLIDQKGNFFYYQTEYIEILCNYGHEKDTLPEFLHLERHNIVRVPQKSLTDFLSENILTKEKDRQILIIASQNDTIKNTSFFEFLNTKNIGNYFIRRTTQEEDTVLKYKNNQNKHIYYYPDSIKWDKTKIKLPSNK